MLNSKKVFGSLVIILVIAGFFYYQKNKSKEFRLITNDEELAEFMQDMEEGDIEKYLEKKDQLYAQDTYGGATPEETLDLYIDALKVGDMELASKYFRLEDQERELGELRELKKEEIDEYVSFLSISKRNKRYDDLVNSYEIDVGYEGGFVTVAKFILNNQTNKWKMESIGN